MKGGQYMVTRKNSDIRALIRKEGLYVYQVAEQLQVASTTLCQWLQRDLDPEKRSRIVQAIESLKSA